MDILSRFAADFDASGDRGEGGGFGVDVSAGTATGERENGESRAGEWNRTIFRRPNPRGVNTLGGQEVESLRSECQNCAACESIGGELSLLKDREDFTILRRAPSPVLGGSRRQRSAAGRFAPRVRR